jgi:hypothetical protein
MNLVFNQSLSVRNGTEFLDQVGAVKQIHCLSLGGVFAAVWDHKVLESNGVQNGIRKLKCPPIMAMFSPFGAQWWCSLEDISEALVLTILSKDLFIESLLSLLTLVWNGEWKVFKCGSACRSLLLS